MINRTNFIGCTGLFILLIAVTLYFLDKFNVSPPMIGKTTIVTAFVTRDKIIPKGKGATHQLAYCYTFNDEEHCDHYYSNKAMARLYKGDSIKLEISILQPSKKQSGSVLFFKPLEIMPP